MESLTEWQTARTVVGYGLDVAVLLIAIFVRFHGNLTGKCEKKMQ